MKVKSKKQFSSSLHGNVSQGQIIDVSVDLYRQMREFDMVEEAEIDQPVKPIAQPALSSQAGQALPENKLTTLQDSEMQESAKLSESTQAVLQQNATLSTPVTVDGGKNTMEKSKRGRPAGRKINTLPANMV